MISDLLGGWVGFGKSDITYLKCRVAKNIESVTLALLKIYIVFEAQPRMTLEILYLPLPHINLKVHNDPGLKVILEI